MSTTNLGGQIVTFKFGQEATSETFNRLLYQMVEQGIYEGATLSNADPLTNRVTVDPGTYVFNDPDYDKIVDLEPYIDGVSVKIQQTLAISDFQISTTEPYVIARFTWENISENYITFESASLADINTLIGAGTPPIIIGRVVFVDGSLQAEFDYTRRTVPYVSERKEKHNRLRVQSDNDGAGPSGGKGVYVTGGTVSINNRLVTWAGGYYNPSPSIPDTTQQRIDLIYLKRDGTIQHRLGEEHPSNPQIPRFPKDGAALAMIKRLGGRETINGSEIENIDIDRQVTSDLVWGVTEFDVNAQDIPLGTAINKPVTGGSDIIFSNDGDVFTAIDTIVNGLVDLSSVEDGAILPRHLGLGTGAGAISAETIPIEDAANRYSTKNVEAALVDISNATFTFYGSKTFNSQVTAPSFNATSLRMLKENVEEFCESALDVLCDTQIYTFNFKDDALKRRKVGFMADETDSYLSTTDKNTMDITNTIGMLIKAVQELKVENEQLRKLIEA